MTLSPRNKLILVAAGLLLAVAALVVLVLMPQYNKYKDLGQRVADSDKRIAAAENLLQVRQEAKARSAFTSAESLELLAAVPENPDLPSMIIELQDLAYQCNVQIRSLEPAVPALVAEYEAAPVNMVVWGSWSDTVDFLQRLPLMTRQVRITEVVTTPLSDGSGATATEPLDKGAVTTNLAIETYLIPAQAATATVPPATTP